MAYSVALILGSLRQASINRRLALAITRLAPPSLAFSWVRIDDLPLFNGDLERSMPPAALRFKADIKAADALLIVSPEHNRSLPTALKNAIDWGSRPWGQSCFAGKPAAIAGASDGNLSTAPMQYHLRGMLAYLDVYALGNPEVQVKLVDNLITEDGTVTVDDTRDFLKGFADRFAEHIARYAAAT